MNHAGADLAYLITKLRFSEEMERIRTEDIKKYEELRSKIIYYMEAFEPAASLYYDFSDNGSFDTWAVVYNQINHLTSKIKSSMKRGRVEKSLISRVSPQRTVEWLFEVSKDAEDFMLNLQDFPVSKSEKKRQDDIILYFCR